MTKTKTAVIVLAAGLGTRMKSDIVKVMHPLAGRPMVAHLMDTVGGIEPDDVAVVVGDVVGDVSEAVVPYPVVQQKERLGTAHAVLQARDTIGDFSGDVLVLYGDTPLVTLDTLDAMLDARASDIDPAVVVLGFTPADAGDYGRLILAEDGSMPRTNII